MNGNTTTRSAAVRAVCLALLAQCGCSPHESVLEFDARTQGLEPAGGALYFSLRRDARGCAPPRCGGYFVSSVNTPLTACPSAGRPLPECYVAGLDLGALALDSGQRAALSQSPEYFLLLGRFSPVALPGMLDLGRLRALEVWRRQTDATPAVTFLRVRAPDGAPPALTARLSVSPLNRTDAAPSFAQLDWSSLEILGAELLEAQLQSESGLIVSAELAEEPADAGAPDAAPLEPDAAAPLRDAAVPEPALLLLRVSAYYLPFPTAQLADGGLADDDGAAIGAP